MTRLLALTLALTLGGAALAQPQAPAVPPASGAANATSMPTTALSVQLPDHPKLRTPLKLNLPSGSTLSVTLSAIARAAGLTVITRDVPSIPVTLNLSGMTTRDALERLLSLYSDVIGARLIENTLIIAPPYTLFRLEGTTGVERRVVEREIDPSDAQRLETLTGARVVPLTGATIVAGSAAQVRDVLQLLPPPRSMDGLTDAVPAVVTADRALAGLDPEITRSTLTALHGVQVTVALGRAYLKGTDEQVKAALVTFDKLREDAARLTPPPAPTAAPAPAPTATVATVEAPAVQEPKITMRRSLLQSLLAPDLLSRLTASVSTDLKLTPLDPGTYYLTGPDTEVAEALALIRDAETREAMRVPVYYQGVTEEVAQGLRAAMPTLSVRATPGGLEVRANPSEQVRVSAYLAVAARSQPARVDDQEITLRLPLSYATPATVVAHLNALYNLGAPAAPAAGQGGAPGAPISAPISAPVTPAVRVVADERSRSILLTGPRSTLTRMQQTVADLDIRLADLRMGLKIEQIGNSNGQDLGISWKVGAGGLSFGQDAGVLSAGYTPGIIPPTVEGKLNVARQEGRSQTLLDTTFVTQDGRSSSFKNGGQLLLPVINVGSDGKTSQTRETYEYGLEVTLTPRLAPDGSVELDVKVQLGQTPRAGVQNSILVEKQTVTSVATVQPGETLVLGGVLTTTDSADKKGVPVLSDIPVIGAMFGTTSKDVSQSVLLITVTAGDRADKRTAAPPLPPALPGNVTRVSVPAKP